MADRSGNPDGNPNSDIAKVGEATQFGKGQDARAVGARSKPWSIRRAIKKLLSKDVPLDPKLLTPEFFAKEIYGKTGKLTPAELLAIKKIQVALGGNVRAMQQLEDSVDGKLIERSVSAKGVTLEQLVTGNFDNVDEDDEQD